MLSAIPLLSKLIESEHGKTGEVDYFVLRLLNQISIFEGLSFFHDLALLAGRENSPQCISCCTNDNNV